jgi:ribosomal protein L35
LRVGGRGALRRDGALLRHRLRRRATRRIPRGRWRGRLSRRRRWRRRSLSGCRAGCHQSCQEQKKRFSLHGEQMLPRYRCSLPAGNRLAYSVYRPSGFGFRGRRAWTASRRPNRTSGAPLLYGARRFSIDSMGKLGGLHANRQN